jgi:hypothetical protein
MNTHPLTHHQPSEYLQGLARLATYEPAATLTCGELTEIVRHARQLNDAGIPGPALRSIARVYARRLDELGPEEFDHRMLTGA